MPEKLQCIQSSSLTSLQKIQGKLGTQLSVNNIRSSLWARWLWIYGIVVGRILSCNSILQSRGKLFSEELKFWSTCLISKIRTKSWKKVSIIGRKPSKVSVSIIKRRIFLYWFTKSIKFHWMKEKKEYKQRNRKFRRFVQKKKYQSLNSLQPQFGMKLCIKHGLK